MIYEEFYNEQNFYDDKEEYMRPLDYFSIDPSNSIDMTKYKKIAISGIGSWGKTTLAKRISSLARIPYLPEVAREILDFSGNFDWKKIKNAEVIENFEKAIFHTHLTLVKTNKVFVSDRSIVDPLVYTIVQSEKLGGKLDNLVKQFTDIIEKQGKLYDVILLADANKGYLDFSKLKEIDYKVIDLFKSKDIINLMLKTTGSLFYISRGMNLIFDEGVVVI